MAPVKNSVCCSNIPNSQYCVYEMKQDDPSFEIIRIEKKLL